MKAKKFFGLLMASAMVASFAACSDDEFTPVYNLPETQKEIGADGGTITVNMECNVVCTETPEADWITASCEETAKGVCTMTLTVAANNSYDAREGKVKVEFALENGTPLQSFYYTVKQAGQEAPYFNIDPATDTITIDFNEATPTWTFETNCQWGEPTIDADWVTIGQQNEQGIRFIAAAFNLPCDSVRYANISVPYTTATGEELTKELVVAQSGKTTFEPADVVGVWSMFMQGNGAVSQKADYQFNADGTYSATSYTISNETGEVMVDPATGEPMAPQVTEGVYTTSEKTEANVKEEAYFNIQVGEGGRTFEVLYDFQTMTMTHYLEISMIMSDGSKFVMGEISQVYTRDMK